MQLIGGLFLKLFSGGAAAGATGAAAGGLSGLQLATGVLGAVATIGQGIAANSQAKAEAAQQEFSARDEFIEGREMSAALKAELAQTIANQQVAFAAGGVDLGSVSVAEARRQASEDAERELLANDAGAGTRMMQRRRAAANARARGRAAMFGSVVGAARGLGNMALDMREA